MSSRPDLVVDWCSYEAAKYAVEHWHYSKTMPAGPARLGVWENNEFIGAILFGWGANKNIGSPYSLKDTQVCELVRIALRRHITEVTKIISIAIAKLKSAFPGLRLIISYADSKEGHLGKIYQAGNWIYEDAKEDCFQMINGSLVHRRTVYSRYGRQDLGWLKENIDPNAKWVYMPPKYKYLYPLDRAMRRQIAPLAKPYPKVLDVRPADGS